jgi:hypothetical protein
MRTAAILIASAALIFTAAAADFAGTYKGTWTGGQADGEITMTLRSGEDGAAKADVSFTIAGQAVKCDVTSVKVEGSNVEVVYNFDLGDVKLQSTATGKLNGKSLEGTYKTKSLGDGSAVDEGTWKASVG